MRPTFEEFMLDHGMHEPKHLPPDALEKWKVRYNLVHPPTPGDEKPGPADGTQPGQVKPGSPAVTPATVSADAPK